MNEQLQQALASILGKTMQGVEAGVSFLSTEIPDVIHQLLLFKLVWSAIIAVILATTCFFLISKGWKVSKKANEEVNSSNKGFPWFVYGAVCVLPSVIMFFVILGSLKNVIQIWLAPKIYLIEYAASLAK